MPQQYHTGGEGIALLDGVDYNVTDADATVNQTHAETTNTSDYVAADRAVYKNQILAGRQATGTLKFGFDSNNVPWDALNNPAGVPVVINFASTGATLTGSVDFSNYAVNKNGMEGKVEVSCSYMTKGPYTLG